MCRTLPSLAQAYAPGTDRAGPGGTAQSPERLGRWLALLIFFLLEPWNAVRLLRYGRLPSMWQARLDLPPGSAQEEAASIRGSFGTAIGWMCRRHGIGPEHADWPELSRAIVAFGGSIEGFRAGLPPCGLQWWDNPNIVPGTVPGFGAPAMTTASLLQFQAEASALPPAPHAGQAKAAHAALPASWLAASRRQFFARAGPGPSTGPPRRPDAITVMSNARGQSMAGPAVLIRAGRKSRAGPCAAYPFIAFDPLAPGGMRALSRLAAGCRPVRLALPVLLAPRTASQA
jgi:hypothetical protein